MAAPALVFDLVPLNGTLAFADGARERARYQVAEFQPASQVAPTLLARVSELAGCVLEVAVPGNVARNRRDSTMPPPGII